MITIKNLNKSFDQQHVLHDINCQFYPGKNNLIIGLSGSGKTVLLKCLIGLLQPDSGEICYEDRNILEYTARQMKRVRREIGVLFQGSALFDSMNVADNVAFPLRMFGHMNRAKIEDVTLKEGDWISINGSTGQVLLGKVETKAAEISGDFAELMDLCNKYTKLVVRTNADTPHDATVARQFGAVGVGLCRTEHMFFEGEKIKAMREMILAEDKAGREKALAKLLPYQTKDFYGILKAMDGLPVNIRLLDPW